MSRQNFSSSLQSSAKLSAGEYQLFREFLQRSSGILLGENKQYLVSSRLSKLMSDQKLANLGELIEKMQRPSYRQLKEAVVDAMTTNETLWFRDSHPFELFKNKILPSCIENNRGRLRLWSAACSSGQEPYSLSMMLEEYIAQKRPVMKPQLDIVATDLSKQMLEHCREAEYDGLSLGRGLSSERQRNYFDTLDNGNCQVKAAIRQRVRFQQLNLMDSYLSLGKFDIVFCRNVLIYFSADLKVDILRRIHATLRPGGYLLLGASEGLSGLGDCYQMEHCHPGIIYRAL